MPDTQTVRLHFRHRLQRRTYQNNLRGGDGHQCTCIYF